MREHALVDFGADDRLEVDAAPEQQAHEPHAARVADAVVVR
jgi:hypothetical protein